MNDNLESFIEVIEVEINKSQSLFFEEWNKLIRRRFNLEEFKIEEHVDIFGGYRLGKDEYERMNPNLKRFFSENTIYNNKIHLRSYDYYRTEPLLHMHSKKHSAAKLWREFRKKGERYHIVESFEYLSNDIVIEDWLGTLGLLEYIFADLTSVRWFIFRNEKMINKVFQSGYMQLVCTVNQLTEIIGESIAAMLKFNFKRAYELLPKAYYELLHSEVLNKLFDLDFDEVEKASIRAMREGDSMALIFAAYMLKLKPLCERHVWKKVLLVSNAFGAMNIGIILKYLIGSDCEVKHGNLLYAQHRSEGDFVYDDYLIGKCCFIDDIEQYDNQDIDAVIVVDDSICFGKSYAGIKESLGHNSTYLLPLTLNCNGMKHFRVGITKDDDIADIIHQSTGFAKELNNIYPAFFSFWDFRNVVPEICSIQDETYKFAMFGSDLLLKHLWMIYYEKIVSNE